MPLLDGGITTRRSGLRLFIPRLAPPGGGGDFVGITLLKLFPPPVLLSRPGDAREFTKPFPKGRGKEKGKGCERTLLMLLSINIQTGDSCNYCFTRA